MSEETIPYESKSMQAALRAFVAVHLQEVNESTARLRAKQLGLDFRMTELCNQFALSACREALMWQEGEIDEAEAMVELDSFSAPDEVKRTLLQEIARKFQTMDEEGGEAEEDEDGGTLGYDELLATIDLSGQQGQRAQAFVALFRGIGGMIEAKLSEKEILRNLVKHAGVPKALAKEALDDYRTIKQYVADYKRGKSFEAQIGELSKRMAYLPVVYALILREHEHGRFQI